MGASQRTKGANGEREVVRILRESLGPGITRNWQAQSAVGGCDLCGIPGWAIEIKRAKQADTGAWWRQTLEQAIAAKRKPLLLFRIDGHGRGLEDDEKWRAMLFLADLTGDACSKGFMVEISLRAWIYMLVRRGDLCTQ